MIVVRFVGIAVAVGLACGLVVAGLGLDGKWIGMSGGALGALFVPYLLLWSKGRPGDAARVGDDTVFHVLLAMAIGVWTFLLGGLLAYWGGTWVRGIGWVLAVIGAGFVVWGAAWQCVWTRAIKVNPALNDERVQANTARADKWAGVVGLNTGALLGLADFSKLVPLSGAFVGYSVLVVFLLTGVSSRAWFEWRDMQG